MKKKWIVLMLALAMVLGLTACGSGSKETELVVFAAASMQETMEEIAEMYKEVEPDVTITYNFDSSGTLKTQIQEGADCDIFISAAPKQMNQLDKNGGEENAEGLDFVLEGTRLDLLENKVVLAVAEAAVDCGIIYATDAFSDGLTVVAEATAEMCGQVIYPAAVLNITKNEEAAKAFLAYLQTDEAAAVFESVGFTPLY